MRTTRSWVWTQRLVWPSTPPPASSASSTPGTVVRWRRVCSQWWTTICPCRVSLLCTALPTPIWRVRTPLSSSVCLVLVRPRCQPILSVCWLVTTSTDGTTRVYSTSRVVATLRLSTSLRRTSLTSMVLSSAMLCSRTLQ